MAKNFQLRVDLIYIKPAIWRRIVVKDTTPLDELHEIIQVAMGWENYHLWAFRTENNYYGPTDPNWEDDMIEASDHKLNELLQQEGDKIGYTYDFGDNWEHIIELEKILPKDQVAHVPAVLQGERHCPPEDCGGFWGYENLLQILKDKKHPEHGEMLEWLGGDFDPEAFDLETTNNTLKEYF